MKSYFNSKKLEISKIDTVLRAVSFMLIIEPIKYNKETKTSKFFNSNMMVNKFFTQAKLHFAYTSKNMTDNAAGKNQMSKTLSLQNFLSDARQLRVYIIAN